MPLSRSSRIDYYALSAQLNILQSTVLLESCNCNSGTWLIVVLIVVACVGYIV
jgi:hypothetical protein